MGLVKGSIGIHTYVICRTTWAQLIVDISDKLYKHT